MRISGAPEVIDMWILFSHASSMNKLSLFRDLQSSDTMSPTQGQIVVGCRGHAVAMLVQMSFLQPAAMKAGLLLRASV